MSKTILLVEDDEALNTAFSTILKKNDYTVHAVYDGNEALKLLAEEKVDLILLDMLMPELDGIGFLKEYDPPQDDKPYIIVFSNLDAKENIDEAMELGADRYLLKSWASPKEILHVVEDSLSLA